MSSSIRKYLNEEVTIAPLVTFRIVYGLLMVGSIIRFAFNGWIEKQYLEPSFHFKYYGFHWVQALPSEMLYVVYLFMLIGAIGIALGWYYRVSAILFFITFSYVELIDKTYYLNHYYFISLIAISMIFIPAHRRCSLDVKNGRVGTLNTVSRFYGIILKTQVSFVYFFAGIAKINYDWLVRAMPLRIWLVANANKPLLGAIFAKKITAYFFSWFGMIYDTTIPLFLSIKKTRVLAFMAVISFHLITGWLFPIGVFPFVMIFSALIFFSPAWHEQMLGKLEQRIGMKSSPGTTHVAMGKPVRIFFIGFLVFQMLFPLRYLLYPGNLFWTEEGYRFSWRVMLMEKAGNATFHVEDRETQQRVDIYNRAYLTPVQEKMMATQPDMIIQYAQYLKKDWEAKGFKNPKVTADVFVTLNGRRSKRFIDPEVDLATQKDTWRHKEWILEE